MALLTAPIGEFFRPDALLLIFFNFEKETYARLPRMIAAAAADLKNELKLTPSGDSRSEREILEDRFGLSISRISGCAFVRKNLEQEVWHSPT